MPTRQEQTDDLHECINDLFAGLHDIAPADKHSREARQSAVLSVIQMRKTLDNMGLRHSVHYRRQG